MQNGRFQIMFFDKKDKKNHNIFYNKILYEITW
jgi:hypothetical protein